MKGPLHGLRVADFSQLVQGPSATQLLGDMGADIVKIEPRGGDWSRNWSIGDTFVQKESLSFLAFNRAKRSITLDLKAPEGKEIALPYYQILRCAGRKFSPRCHGPSRSWIRDTFRDSSRD